jgi:hypothetical protein
MAKQKTWWIASIILIRLSLSVYAYIEPIIHPEQTINDWKTEKITLHQAVKQLIRYHNSTQQAKAHLM